jgi:ketosteroid isomerase-like protein
VPSRRSSTIDHLLAAFNARDLDGWMAHATEDFTIESRFSSVAGTIFRGREGVVAWWNDLADAWEWLEVELEDSADVGTDRTVILLTLRGMGRKTSVRLDESIAHRWYWRGKRVQRTGYLDRQEAELIVR